MLRPFAIVFTAASLLSAQASAPSDAGTAKDQPKQLVYSGKPINLAPACRPEDLAALGLACTVDEPCPILLELAAIEAVASRILIIGNLHTTSVTLESVLLASEDGGHTWTEANVRMPAASFDQIQFIDFENGWISGQTTTTLPRDPFFLVSKDGGKSWHNRPVFSEPRVGLVEGFWFSSKTRGAMTIDRLQSADDGMRYELYDTSTGGDSWSLQKISDKPIALKRPAHEEGDLRLRPDSSKESYRVEQRAGDKWQTVAMFAIASGECRPPETKLAEPEPEPSREPSQPAIPPPKPAKKKR